MREKLRDKNIDALKGILIILVVVGHFQRDTLHDIIFLFHMPLFFILSGIFFQKEKLIQKHFLQNKAVTFLIPYSVYLLLDLFFIQREYSLGSIVRALWGGRAISGVYWYITCFLFAVQIFAFFIVLPEWTVKCLILLGGGIAVIESNLAEKIYLLRSPGVPWNIDVALMALVYIGIGYFYKDRIKRLMKVDAVKYDVAAIAVAILLVGFCWINYQGGCFYYFDMKSVYYRELAGAIFIPCAFGLVLSRMVSLLSRIKVLGGIYDFIALCGRATIPIMFMHIPLNHWKESIGYGRSVFTLIGIGVPLMFTFIFSRFSIMRKLFGLPDLL